MTDLPTLQDFLATKMAPNTLKTIDDIMCLSNSAHLVSPYMKDKAVLVKEVVKTQDTVDLIASINERFSPLDIVLPSDGVADVVIPKTITIGQPALDHASSASGATTRLNAGAKANADGTLDTVDLWMYGSSAADVTVGTYYLTSGTTYVCRASTLLGTVASGSKQTFTGLSVAVETNDLLGIYMPSSYDYTELSYTGGNGAFYKTGEYKDPGDSASYTLSPNHRLSLYGTGTEAGGGTDYEKSLSDTVAIADSMVKAVGKYPSDEAVAISDTLSKGVGLNKAEAAFTLSDSIVKEPGKVLADTVTLADATPVKSAGKILADTIAIADSPVKAVGKILADTVTIGESLSKAIGQAFSDTVTIADTFARAVSYIKALSDTVTITDSLAKSFGKIISDTVTIADTFVKGLVTIWAIALSDTITITDSLVGVHRFRTTYRMAVSRLGVVRQSVARLGVNRMNVARLPLIRWITRRFTA